MRAGATAPVVGADPLDQERQMFPTELVFIDAETTALAGPEANTDAIIEVAAARVNLKTRETVDEWSLADLFEPWGAR
jgi:DNA polymerase III alpha subunit (gram-positive type)